MRTKETPRRTKKYANAYRRKRKRLTIVGCLAAVVAFCTVYALILPAATKEETTYCGVEAHEHGEDCYEKSHVCTKEERTHINDCYTEEPDLICG